MSTIRTLTTVVLALLLGTTVTATANGATLPPAPTNTTTFGMNVWDIPTLDTAEQQLGVKAGVVGIYQDWVHNTAFPTALVSTISARGSVPMISWEPWDSWKPSSNQPAYTPKLIASGKYNKLVDTWLLGAKKYNKTVLVRFAAEMNGDWQAWSPNKLTNKVTATHYVSMWKYVVNRAKMLGVTNVKWVWNPIVKAGETTPMETMFPGEAFVDWTAMDGYNWGFVKGWGWQSYDDIFASTVPVLKRLAPTKPWMIAETACAPDSRQAEWVMNTFTRANQDGAKAVVWFQFNKETDWRLTSNTATINAVQSLLTSSQFNTTLQTLTATKTIKTTKATTSKFIWFR